MLCKISSVERTNWSRINEKRRVTWTENILILKAILYITSACRGVDRMQTTSIITIIFPPKSDWKSERRGSLAAFNGTSHHSSDYSLIECKATEGNAEVINRWRQCRERRFFWQRQCSILINMQTREHSAVNRGAFIEWSNIISSR